MALAKQRNLSSSLPRSFPNHAKATDPNLRVVPLSTMKFPSYRPLTQNDHKFGVLGMLLGAAWFTIVAASYHKTADLAHAHVSWPAIISPFFPFFGGFLWLVLDSWYHGRAWWHLLFWSGGGIGVTRLLGFTGFLPIAFDLWAWSATMAVILFKTDFMGDHNEASREAPLGERVVNEPGKLAEQNRLKSTRHAGDAA